MSESNIKPIMAAFYLFISQSKPYNYKQHCISGVGRGYVLFEYTLM